jgi:hypothetical protein
VNGTITDSAGNVGIGDTTPSAKLDVAGNIAVNGTQVINSSGQWVGTGGGLTPLGIKAGVVSGVGLQDTTVTFRTPYPNASYSVQLTPETYRTAGLTIVPSATLVSKSTTGFTIYIHTALSPQPTITCHWLTIPFNDP